MADKAASLNPVCILIVEDESIFARQLKDLLTGLGYEVTAAVPTGEEALQSVAEHPPDLVLMDIKLAGALDGIGTALLIQARLDVPIVYLSAYSEQLVMAEIQDTRAYGFLTKPVRDSEVGATVELALYKHRMEAKLRESEARYRLLAENVEDVIWQLDETLDTLTYISPSITRLLGYTPEEMRAMQIETYLSPEFRSQVQQFIARLLSAEKDGYRDDQPRMYEVECIRKDGTTVWVESSTRALRDADGRFQGLVGVARDISARKRTEEALKENEKRYRELLNSINDGIAVMDADFNVIQTNRALRRDIGKDQDVVGEECFTAFYGFESNCAWCPAKKVLATGKDQSTVVPFPAENPQRWFHLQASPLRNTRGEITGVVESARDITEQKRIEEALRAAKERLQILYEIDTAILAAQSPEAIARAALERVDNLIPYQRASISEIDLTRQQGRDVVIMIPEGALKIKTPKCLPLLELSDIIETAQRGQTYLVQDLVALETFSPIDRYLSSIGIRAYVSVPMIVQGELVGMLNLAVDKPNFFQPGHIEVLEEVATSLAIAMQQAKLLAQTQRDAEMKALLLQEVNHRVMNNLIMIRSILELEMKQSRSEDKRTERVVRSVLQDICGRIRGISIVHRMLSNTQQDALNPSKLISQVIHAALSGSPIQQHIAVSINAPESLPRVSAKQAVTLALVINELTTNSIKYAFADRVQGYIHVQIEKLETENREPAMQLVFRDDGPGLPENVLAREQRSIGLWLIQTSVTHTLRGEITWRTDGGAVVEIQFPI